MHLTHGKHKGPEAQKAKATVSPVARAKNHQTQARIVPLHWLSDNVDDALRGEQYAREVLTALRCNLTHGYELHQALLRVAGESEVFQKGFGRVLQKALERGL